MLNEEQIQQITKEAFRKLQDDGTLDQIRRRLEFLAIDAQLQGDLGFMDKLWEKFLDAQIYGTTAQSLDALRNCRRWSDRVLEQLEWLERDAASRLAKKKGEKRLQLARVLDAFQYQLERVRALRKAFRSVHAELENAGISELERELNAE
jgi:hypothetical protein